MQYRELLTKELRSIDELKKALIDAIMELSDTDCDEIISKLGKGVHYEQHAGKT